MYNSDRRDFLKLLSAFTMGGAFSGLALAAQRALAQQSADPEARFILFRVNGAMDSTLGLHPYLQDASQIDEQDLYLGYSDEAKVLTNIDGTRISLGPSALKVAPFAKQMAIVRGIFVGPNDLGHPFALQHMTSGRIQESAPSWASYVGSRFTEDGSYVVTNAPLQRGTLTPFPSHLTSVLRTQVAKMAAGGGNSPLSIYTGNQNMGVTHYLNLLSQKQKLQDFLTVFNSVEGTAPDEIVALAALYSGLARVAQIDISVTDGGNMDTHQAHKMITVGDNKVGHQIAQAHRWKRIGTFLKKLKELSLLDKTVVVVITEFNRTPGMNANGGKDHNYQDNAVAIFGRGVNGGTVVGDHTLYKREDGFPYAYWAGKHIDFSTGQTIEVKKGETAPDGASLIHPGDVWASVIASLDPGLKSQLPEGAKIIPGLFST